MNPHRSTPEEYIVSVIEEIGHSVRNFTNVKFQQIKHNYLFPLSISIFMKATVIFF